MKIEVRIWQDYGSDTTKIIFVERDIGKSRVINLFTQEVRELKEYEQIPEEFILKLSRWVSQDILQGLAEALDKNGIKTEKDAKIQGLLEATKYHLEDMRSLVFKKAGEK